MFYFCQMLDTVTTWQICLRNHFQSVVEIVSEVASVFIVFM